MNETGNENRVHLAAVTMALAALLALAVHDITRGSDGAKPSAASPSTSSTNLTLDASQILLSVETFGTITIPGSTANPFYTDQFVPVAKKIVPPAPVTKTEKITYQGYFESATGDRKAFVKTGTDSMAVSFGDKLLDELEVTTINPSSLVLTDSNGVEHSFEIRMETTYTSPIK